MCTMSYGRPNVGVLGWCQPQHIFDLLRSDMGLFLCEYEDQSTDTHINES